MIFEAAKGYLKNLTSEDKEAVLASLKKLRLLSRGKGTKAGSLFKTISKKSVVGKAGGVTRQGGGTRRGD